MDKLILPEILDIPEKLLPIITEFNNYRYFLIDGGRSGAKSQSVARFLLYLAEKKENLRIVCGREIQKSIEESVYTILSDLITQYNLYFTIQATKIMHRKSGSTFNFRGFREQGRFNIQGMEGVHVLWIDEGQAITQPTLSVLIPTIRKEKAKVFFTMNREEPEDPVYKEFSERADCLHIKINYDENKFCPEAMKKEAEECRLKNPMEYRHIWMGEPVSSTGKVYPQFEAKDPYVVSDFVVPDNWARVCIVDPHDGIPFAITWAAIDKAGQIWIYKEYPFDDLEKYTSTDLTVPDYARLIREIEGRDRMAQRIIDPYFANKRYANTGMTIKQELSELGLIFEDGDTSGLDVGHKRVMEFLNYIKDKPVTGTNHPKLHIFESCRNHWRSLLKYKRKIAISGEVKDKITLDETYKHFCDNIRHLVMKADFQKLKGEINYYDWYAEEDDDEEVMPHDRYRRTISVPT